MQRLPPSSAPSSRRRQRLDRLVLPTVVVLLLLGAAFILAAWTQAADAIEAAERKDEIRAERLAGSVAEIVESRFGDVRAWISGHQELLAPGNGEALRRKLIEHVGEEGRTVVAWAVVGSDGAILAVGERSSGRIEASGIADDLAALGRRSVSSGSELVSDLLKLGDDHAYAVAVPVAQYDVSVIRVTDVRRSAIGSFLPASAPTEVDEVALVDSRGRQMLGRGVRGDAERVRRPVEGTGWSIVYSREELGTILPDLAYPAFALLLAAFALAYAFQDVGRRRLRRLGDARLRQVESLYDLASSALHAGSIEQQADHLSHTAMELAHIDGAEVHVDSVDGGLVRSAGRVGEPTHRMEIMGPRGPLGELVVSRADGLLEGEEVRVLRTGATLVGAAMHTLVSLETERAAKRELLRLDELRSNLLATVAHELLSPLTAVKGVLGLMSMQEDLDERGRRHLEVATERTDRLVALIRDLFDCSLIETGQLDIQPTRQRADELLEASMGAQAAARQGELRISATPNLMVTVDPVRFDQLLNNLVSNAFRHGSPPVEVVVRPADHGVLVIVSDEGPGIPQEEREQVFDRFWQGSSGHSRRAQGAGLGLSLVRGLVRVHGGDIRVDSTRPDGRGARFTVFLPDEPPAPTVHAPDGVDGAASLV